MFHMYWRRMCILLSLGGGLQMSVTAICFIVLFKSYSAIDLLPRDIHYLN